MADAHSGLVDTPEIAHPLQNVSDDAIEGAPMEDPVVTSSDSPNVVSSSTLLNSPPDSWTWPHHPRLFLDICSGAGYPLSKAMLECGCACFPVDI